MNGILAEQQWKGKLVAGALAAILGGVLLAWPGPSILVVSVLFGVYLLVSGFTEVYMAFTLPRSAPARVMWFIAGALSVVMAIFSFRHFGEGYAVLLLSLWVGVGFTFLGVSEIAVAGSLPALPGRFWYIVTGVISMIAGGVVVAWPFDSIVALDIGRTLASHRRKYSARLVARPSNTARQRGVARRFSCMASHTSS